jgi:hypothetical protein
MAHVLTPGTERSYFVMNDGGVILADFRPSGRALADAQTYAATHNGPLTICESDGTAFRVVDQWPAIF